LGTISGISVIICCFNSELRITSTLEALSKVDIPENVSCEFVLVDNNCTDKTVEVALSTWQAIKSTVPLQIVFQKTPGLANARRKGIEVSQHPVLVFCDDDNWLSEGYLKFALGVLNHDQKVAAVGGHGIPVFEGNGKPAWFDEFSEAFAVGRQDMDVENGRLISLYGAGLVVRRSALAFIDSAGFRPYFTGRKGKYLSSTEDTELTNVLVLCGFKLFYSKEMVFHHFMPSARMNETYLTNLFAAFGNDAPVRNLYHSFLSQRVPHRWMRFWSIQVVVSVFRLVKYWIIPPKKGGRKVYLSWSVCNLKSLIRLHGKFKEVKLNLQRIERSASSLWQNNRIRFDDAFNLEPFQS
jgi:glycosyltransferase involved in cell wall biosynthesis